MKADDPSAHDHDRARDLRKLGVKINRLRKEANLTEDQVGAVLGCSRQQVSKLERGKVNQVNWWHVRALAKLFDVSTEYLADDSADEAYPATDQAVSAIARSGPEGRIALRTLGKQMATPEGTEKVMRLLLELEEPSSDDESA